MDEILQELRELGIEVDSIGGAAPLQIWGRIDGCWFYFRARWGAWEFCLSESAASVEDVARLTLKATGVGNFYYSGNANSETSPEPDEGLAILLRCAAAYRCSYRG